VNLWKSGDGKPMSANRTLRRRRLKKKNEKRKKTVVSLGRTVGVLLETGNTIEAGKLLLVGFQHRSEKEVQ
jgi:hypothetical protein